MHIVELFGYSQQNMINMYIQLILRTIFELLSFNSFSTVMILEYCKNF